MRYNENKYDNEIKDLFDLIRVGFISILAAPYRLLSEISTKIMFLDRRVIEQTLLVTAIIDLLALVYAFIKFLITDKISLFSGIVPVVPVVLVLILTGVLAWVVSLKFEGTGVEVTTEQVAPSQEHVTVVTEDDDGISAEDFDNIDKMVASSSAPQTSAGLSPESVLNDFNFTDDEDLLASLVRPADLQDIDVSSFFGGVQKASVGELDKELLKDLVSTELNINNISSGAVSANIRNNHSMGIDHYKEELLK